MFSDDQRQKAHHLAYEHDIFVVENAGPLPGRVHSAIGQLDDGTIFVAFRKTATIPAVLEAVRRKKGEK